MNPRLLRHYTRELQYIRQMGGEFAKEFPKIAGRLGLEGFECADPYVERLLEGFAFLAARVQLKLDAEFPEFTQHLLEMVYPHYLEPTPSMAVVQFQPDLSEGALGEGYPLPRHTVLRSVLGRGEQTPCEYRTAHALKLWPLELVEARYFAYAGEVATIPVPGQQRVKAGIRFRLRSTAGLTFDKLALDSLNLYLRGIDELPMRVYELLLGHTVALLARPVRRPTAWHEVIDRSRVRRVGFADDEALLPHGPRSFQGYRLLQEYFAFAERYMFVELGGLSPAVRRCTDAELDVIVLLDQGDVSLENALDASHFALFCTPAVNLFPKRADRIHLSERENEYHVVPDRTRPLDFEVCQVAEVVGHGTSAEAAREFLPFYSADALTRGGDGEGYFTVRREPRELSSKQRDQGPRSRYVGSELFVSLVDAAQAPYRSDMRQLAIHTLCTNRDLPLHMPVGQGKTDFNMESGAPVEAVRCLAGPSRPGESWVARDHDEMGKGSATWRLISHLSLNYLSLIDREQEQNAAALREMLALYGDLGRSAIQKQIEGVRALAARSVVRRIPIPGPITFGRGLEIGVTLDEVAFEGTGVFLLGAVLEQFFTRYVSLNSFTETVVRTGRGEVIRWPARIGRRQTL